MGDRPAVKLVWYDGGKLPQPPNSSTARPDERAARVVVGDKGKLMLRRRDASIYRLSAASEPDVKFPESPGHFEEWVRAIQGGEPAMSNFPDYAGPLTETMLLGNLAVWAAHEINSTLGDEKAATGERIEWDAEKLAAEKRSRPGRPHQTRLISRRLYARCLTASHWKRS